MLICVWGSAQQTGVVHIQAENGQPFYVEWNGYRFSSSGTGYLVIPRMQEGEQVMVIGFSKGQFPEQIFRYRLGDTARGFSLKLNIDNSLSMFDMVDFSVIRGKTITAAEKREIALEMERVARAGGALEKQDNQFKAVDMSDSSGIHKIFGRITAEGTDLVYVVMNQGVMDTVVIFIPAEAVSGARREDKSVFPGNTVQGPLQAMLCGRLALLNRRRPLTN